MFKFSNRDNHSKKIFIIVTVIVIIVVIFISSLRSGKGNIFSSATGGVNNIFTTASNEVSSFFGYFKTKKKLNAQIDKLKKENEKLKLNNFEMKKLESENNSLRKKLEIKEQYRYFKMVVGHIQERNQSNWNEYFVVNVGEKDGVKEGMPVINKDGIIGQVVSTTKDTSKVMTILDTASSISVEIGSINQTAVCKGDYSLKGKNKIKLIYVPIDAEISPGDIVYTSGISDIYPKGLPIGKIVEVKNSKNEINRYAIVETFADIVTVNEIAIITE